MKRLAVDASKGKIDFLQVDFEQLFLKNNSHEGQGSDK